jgi:glycosyltransferase involved in cell wall biosynthesis
MTQISGNTLPTICLNMIVKNESKIIVRLLESVLPLIDSYCICDTGSTDGTAALIESFFGDRGIPGKIVYEPFRDFGYNRSFALNAAVGQPLADYLLLLDADMVLEYPIMSKTDFTTGTSIDMNATVKAIKHRIVEHDVWHIFQGTPHMFYKNARMVRNLAGNNYWGVTHEYLQPFVSDKGCTYGTFERDSELFIHDVGDGGSKSDKCERDIRLLTQGLVDHPNNDRYTFYLANSYRDNGDNQLAIDAYTKRIELGGWIEEIWQSYYNIGKCHMRMGNPALAIHAWTEAYHAHPARIENLYDIVSYYRQQSRHSLAYTFYLLADYERRRVTQWDYLFLQKDVYDYKLDYELTIVGYYCNRNHLDLVASCMHVLGSPGAEDWMCRNVLSNYKFYAWTLEEHSLPISDHNRRILAECGGQVTGEGLVSSTPSMCKIAQDRAMALCVRHVNYRIDDQGQYINQEHIVTKNVVSIVDTTDPDKWTKVDEFELQYDTSLDDRYVGLEDVRLWCSPVDGQLHYNANRASPLTKDGEGNRMHIEHGRIDLPERTTRDDGRLQYEHARDLEKNWVLFAKGTENGTGDTLCVYNWSPLVIGDISEKSHTFTEIHRSTEVPRFFSYVRGSTNGVAVTGKDGSDEMWFLCHVVSYEDRRFYYHLVVVLDRNTLAVKKYTSLFTFHAHAKVEYTLGFVATPGHKQSSQFLIGYSVNDCETKYMNVSRDVLEQHMIEHKK